MVQRATYTKVSGTPWFNCTRTVFAAAFLAATLARAARTGVVEDAVAWATDAMELWTMFGGPRHYRAPENVGFERPGAAADSGMAGVPSRRCISFGRFRVFPAERRITKDGKPISVGGRAFDILVTLAEQPGVVVSKAALLARVWPGLNVEESSLRVHVAALRRALGDGIGATRHIVNVAGRGYCFVASVAFDEFNPIRLPRTLIEDACALANAQGMSVDQFFSSLITDRIDALKALPRTRRRIGGP